LLPARFDVRVVEQLGEFGDLGGAEALFHPPSIAPATVAM
jgi:hypothetical protein